MSYELKLCPECLSYYPLHDLDCKTGQQRGRANLAIAAPAVQEPVAYRRFINSSSGFQMIVYSDTKQFDDCEALYAAPQPPATPQNDTIPELPYQPDTFTQEQLRAAYKGMATPQDVKDAEKDAIVRLTIRRCVQAILFGDDLFTPEERIHDATGLIVGEIMSLDAAIAQEQGCLVEEYMNRTRTDFENAMKNVESLDIRGGVFAGPIAQEHGIDANPNEGFFSNAMCHDCNSRILDCVCWEKQPQEQEKKDD